MPCAADMDNNNSPAIVYNGLLEKALEDFVGSQEKVLNPQLFQILDDIAKMGVTCYLWSHLKVLISFRIKQIFAEFVASVAQTLEPQQVKPLEDQQHAFIGALEAFPNAPFTIQRLCELVLTPTLYRSFPKYLFALQKVINVTSTQAPLNPAEYNATIEELIIQKQHSNFRNQMEQFQEPKPVSRAPSPISDVMDIQANHVDCMEDPDKDEISKMTPMEVETTPDGTTITDL